MSRTRVSIIVTNIITIKNYIKKISILFFFSLFQSPSASGKLQQPISPIKRLESKKKWLKKIAMAAPSRRVLVSLASESSLAKKMREKKIIKKKGFRQWETRKQRPRSPHISLPFFTAFSLSPMTRPTLLTKCCLALQGIDIYPFLSCETP